MKLFIDIVMKRIYLFNTVSLKLQRENRISGSQKEKFRRPSSAPEARKERSCQSYSASHIKWSWRAEHSFHRPTFIRPAANHSTHVRATCNFNTEELRWNGDLKNYPYNIMTF